MAIFCYILVYSPPFGKLYQKIWQIWYTTKYPHEEKYEIYKIKLNLVRAFRIELPRDTLSVKFEGYESRDRCVDFKNVFAEKLSEKMAFLTQNKGE
jgi:hypothetical protein